LSLPEPPITRTADTVYGMSALDRGGRIADRAAIDALGWTPGTRLHLDAHRTYLTLSATIDGALAVKDHRYLWLPAAARHRLGLRPSDRVLLAAQPQRQTLVIYPLAALDELLATGGGAVTAMIGNLPDRPNPSTPRWMPPGSC
jgi:hypothetical protein